MEREETEQKRELIDYTLLMELSESYKNAALPHLSQHNFSTSDQKSGNLDQPTPSTVAGDGTSGLDDLPDDDDGNYFGRAGSSPDQATTPEWPTSRLDLRRELCDQNLFLFHLPSDWREVEVQKVGHASLISPFVRGRQMWLLCDLLLCRLSPPME